MDCFFNDPRLNKKNIKTTTSIRIKSLSTEQTTSNHPKRIKLNHHHQLDTTTTQLTLTQHQPKKPITQNIIHLSNTSQTQDKSFQPKKSNDISITTTTKLTATGQNPKDNQPQTNNNTINQPQQHDYKLNDSHQSKQNDYNLKDNNKPKSEDHNKTKQDDYNLKDNIQSKQNDKLQDHNKTKQNENNDHLEDNNQTQAIKPQTDQHTNHRTTNHQDYQLHPIIPRSVDKSISAYSASHPLQTEPSPQKLTSSAKLINGHRNQFKPWFTNQDPLRWPFNKQDPQLRVIYPTGAHELFPLLVPKNDQEDEYRPLDDLLNVVTTTLTYYLTPDQSLHFFSEPHPITSHSVSASHTQLNDFSFLDRPSHQDRSSPEAGSSSIPKIPLSDPSLDMSGKPLLKELLKAIRRKNGPEFLGLVGWYNRVVKHLIDQGSIGQQIKAFVGMPQGIWATILGQAYDRQVGPQLELLQGYETWSSNVYGELKPRFVSEIIRLVDLRPGMIFLDLGSGIGNIVLQVALEVGCVAVGFEIMDGCATLANHQCREVVGRAHSLWGLNLGSPLLFQADFTKDPRVGQWLRQADVVLVNNQVFTPSLNESLSLLFLELKDTAKIVSLKPFISSSFKLNQRNLHSPLAILTRPTVRPSPPSTLISSSPGVYKYPSNSVSWTDNPGEFFLSVVDRSQLINFQSKISS